MTAATDTHSVVLVEGRSDQVALETLAARQGRDLAADGVAVVPMGGARSISRYLRQYGPRGEGLRLAGLCDAGEEGDFRRGLERAGLGEHLTRTDMEELGFFVCVVDLEDELIRCLGADAVERVLDAHGDLGSFRILQQQPAHRDGTDEARLRRFMGTRSGRKLQYARLLVESLDLDNVPRPLDLLLRHVG